MTHHVQGIATRAGARADLLFTLVALLGSAACKPRPTEGHPAPTAPTAPAASTTRGAEPVAVATVSGAAVPKTAPAPSAGAPNDECGTPPPYAIKPAKSPRTVASPAWAEESEPLLVRWEVQRPRKTVAKVSRSPVPPYLALEEPARVYSKVELVLSAGKTTRRIFVGEVSGTYSGVNQSFCENKTAAHVAAPNAHAEISWVAFSEGGLGGFLVRLVRPGLLQVVRTEGSDGMCSQNSVTRTEVATVPVPEGATFVEALKVTGNNGKVFGDPCSDDWEKD